MTGSIAADAPAEYHVRVNPCTRNVAVFRIYADGRVVFWDYARDLAAAVALFAAHNNVRIIGT